jgi:hypothetical protein
MPVLTSDCLETDPKGTALLRRCLSQEAGYRARAALADPRMPKVPRPPQALRAARAPSQRIQSLAERPGWAG